MNARYKEIASYLVRSIQEGLLRPGERLPSLRILCQGQGVSLMTALAAYRHLERLGLVEAVPRSGYRVLADPVPALRGPAITRSRLTAPSTRRADIVAQTLAAMADPALTPLGFGCPGPDCYPLDALARITTRLLGADRTLWSTYSMPPGNPELRRQIARRLQARGMAVGADEVLVTNGAMEGLSLALRLLVAPGGLVAVECPTFFGILDAARSSGAQLVELPGDPEEGLDPARLEAVCARHRVAVAVLAPVFANPTGSLMCEARKRAWMDTLQKTGVALVEDDVYGDLAWDGRQIPPLAALRRQDGLPNLLVGSFSKSLLGGGRVGYLAARSPWIERLTDLKNTSTLANATLPEAVAAECLATGLYERHLRRLSPRLQAGVRVLREGIKRHFPPGTRVSDPRGGYLLWVELPWGSDGLALFHAARGEGVSIAPGCLFSLGGGLDRFIRLNAGAGGDLEAALGILGRLAGTPAVRSPSNAV
jgi:DNA-binding transcriptional MocR family regulator